VNRPRAADDFAAIRARMEELRREREAAQAPESKLQLDAKMRPARNAHWSHGETSAGSGAGRPVRPDTPLGL
jgi:hypothetical protein